MRVGRKGCVSEFGSLRVVNLEAAPCMEDMVGSEFVSTSSFLDLTLKGMEVQTIGGRRRRINRFIIMDGEVAAERQKI
eukprot:3065028-Ditylum_brightwellii.AAC.1